MGGGQGAQLVDDVCLAPLEVGQATDCEGLQNCRERERHLASQKQLAYEIVQPIAELWVMAERFAY